MNGLLMDRMSTSRYNCGNTGWIITPRALAKCSITAKTAGYPRPGNQCGTTIAVVVAAESCPDSAENADTTITWGQTSRYPAYSGNLPNALFGFPDLHQLSRQQKKGEAFIRVKSQEAYCSWLMWLPSSTAKHYKCGR